MNRSILMVTLIKEMKTHSDEMMARYGQTQPLHYVVDNFRSFHCRGPRGAGHTKAIEMLMTTARVLVFTRGAATRNLYNPVCATGVRVLSNFLDGMGLDGLEFDYIVFDETLSIHRNTSFEILSRIREPLKPFYIFLNEEL